MPALNAEVLSAVPGRGLSILVCSLSLPCDRMCFRLLQRAGAALE